MADTFKLQNSDPIVRARLNSDERAAVGTWQVETSYDFEFHGGHATGGPIDVRPGGDADTSDLPKFDSLDVYRRSHGPSPWMKNGTRS